LNASGRTAVARVLHAAAAFALEGRAMKSTCLHGTAQSARDAITGGALLEPQLFDAGIEAIRAWPVRADAALWYASFWAEGVRR
jgi:hypothetical protein